MCAVVSQVLVQAHEQQHHYQQKQHTKNNKLIFKPLGDKCVWWYHKHRYWHLSDCEYVGTSIAFAYIDAEVPCPHPGVNVIKL